MTERMTERMKEKMKIYNEIERKLDNIYASVDSAKLKCSLAEIASLVFHLSQF